VNAVPTGRTLVFVSILSVAGAAGCAGNGDGLNQNGQPIGSGDSTGPVTAELQSIEDNVFTPICSKCHIGAGAPEGLQLDAAHAYDLLVGVPSAEEPAFLRVNPGNPDASYLALKIEGAAAIEGAQMPLGEAPLPQATIDAIRQWIANGAPNVPEAAAASRTFAVGATVPVDRSTVEAPVGKILVTFTQEVDASLVNESTVSLERLDDADLETPHRIAAAASLARDNAEVLVITPRRPLTAGLYRVRVRGTGGGALASLAASTLGCDLSLVFTVEATP
jgi:hypothetical protein